SRFQCAKENVPCHGVAVLCVERVDILLREEEVTEIEQLQIRLQEFFRNFLIQLLPSIVALLQQPPDRHGDRFLRRRYRRWTRNRSRQNDGAQCQALLET